MIDVTVKLPEAGAMMKKLGLKKAPKEADSEFYTKTT